MGSTYFNKRIPMRTATRRARDRPKTFKTKEQAEKYAHENKLTHVRAHKMNEHKWRLDHHE
jgi:hypothetical protein